MHILPLAIFLDALLGEAPNRLHPVCILGHWAVGCEGFFRRCFSVFPGTSFREFLAGMLATVAVVLPFVTLAVGLVVLAGLLGSGFMEVMAALVVYTCLAPRSLGEHAVAVAVSLERSNESYLQERSDLDAARSAVARMVGRDVRDLDAGAVGRACVESVGENLVDGVLSTIFWACVGQALCGPAGAAGLAALHRACNTLDAMWGKRNDRYRHFGTCAARLDDGLGWLPARLSLPIIALAATVIRQDGRAALRIGWRDRAAHASPNSAWSEAAFAGALGLRLGGPDTYGGVVRPVPYLGDEQSTARVTPTHIRAAVTLMWASTLLSALLAELVLVVLAYSLLA